MTEIMGQAKGWQWFRTVMEAVTVAAILYIASSLTDLKVDIATLKAQASSYTAIPLIQQKQVELNVRVDNLEDGMREIRSVSGVRTKKARNEY